MRARRRWSIPVARVSGIEIRVHATFVFLVALFAIPVPGGATVPENLAFLAVIVVCIVVHELAHSVVARRRGATVHEIVLLPIGGVSKLEHLPETWNDEFAIAVVGPVTSVAIGLLGALVAVAAREPLFPIVLSGESLLVRTVWFNLLVGGFNLLPAFPLDGGRVLRALLERRHDLETATRRAARLGRWLAVALVVVGVFLDLWLVLIGGFVYLGASAEEAATLVHLRLEGRRVGDAMALDPATVAAGATADDVRLAARRTAQRWFPVVADGACRGMVDVDALDDVAAGAGIGSHVVDCAPLDVGDELEDALERLQGEHVDALPVVSGTRVVGLLRIDDVMHAAARRPRVGSQPRS